MPVVIADDSTIGEDLVSVEMFWWNRVARAKSQMKPMFCVFCRDWVVFAKNQMISMKVILEITK